MLIKKRRQAIEAPNRQFAFSITCCEMCIGVMKTRQPPIKRRYGVRPDRDREDEQRSRQHPRHRHRKGDREKGAPAAGAETPGRLFQGRIDPLDDADQRQNHEWQRELNHPDDDAEFVVHQRQRIGDDTPARQRVVDQSGVAEQDHQTVHADDQVELHRGQDHDHVEICPARPLLLGDEEGQRIPEHQCQHRG